MERLCVLSMLCCVAMATTTIGVGIVYIYIVFFLSLYSFTLLKITNIENMWKHSKNAIKFKIYENNLENPQMFNKMFIQEERIMPRRSTRSRSRGRAAEPVASPKTPKTPKSSKKVISWMYILCYHASQNSNHNPRNWTYVRCCNFIALHCYVK